MVMPPMPLLLISGILLHLLRLLTGWGRAGLQFLALPTRRRRMSQHLRNLHQTSLVAPHRRLAIGRMVLQTQERGLTTFHHRRLMMGSMRYKASIVRGDVEELVESVVAADVVVVVVEGIVATFGDEVVDEVDVEEAGVNEMHLPFTTAKHTASGASTLDIAFERYLRIWTKA